MKKIKILVIILVLVFGVSFIYFSISNNKNDNFKEDVENEKLSIVLFFTNEDRNNFLPETQLIEKAQGDNLIKLVINELIEGPEHPEFKSTLPSDTKLIDANVEGTVTIVNFTKEFLNTNNTTDEIISRYSVVNTLCSLENINKVKILVEGNEITDEEGNPVGIMGKEDIVLEAGPEQSEINSILYFVGSDGEYLVPETRKVNLKEGSLERYIVEGLLEGPKDDSLYKTIPEEVKLLNIETKEGTCFVNFSEELISKHWGGSAGEIFTIYSVVNSLTELDYIDKVQFLIEGKKREAFIHMIFNEPFERDKSLIKNIEK